MQSFGAAPGGCSADPAASQELGQLIVLESQHPPPAVAAATTTTSYLLQKQFFCITYIVRLIVCIFKIIEIN